MAGAQAWAAAGRDQRQMIDSWEGKIKEYLMALVAMDGMAVAMF